MARPSVRLCALGVLALGASGCLDTILPKHEEVPEARPDASVAWCFTLPEVIDFGEVEVSNVGLRHFRAINTSSVRQRLELGPIDLPFTGVATRDVVPPGGTADVLLTFSSNDALARFSRATFIGGNDCPPQLIELRGLGGGLLTASQFVGFGPLELNVAATRPLRLTNTRRFPVEVDLADADRNPVFTVTPAHVTVPATGSAEVQIGFTPLVPGAAETRLVISSSAGDALETFVSAMGGLPHAEVRPTALDIARMPISEPVSRALEIFNHGEGDLEIVTVRLLSGDGGTAIDANAFGFRTFVSPDASMEVSLFFAPQQPGPHDWVVQITTSDRDRPIIDVPIHAQAEDIAACPMAFMVPQMIGVIAPLTTTDVQVDFDNSAGTVECVVDDPHVQQNFQPGLPVLLEPERQFVVPAGGRAVRTLRVSQRGFFSFSYHPIGRGTQAVFVEVQ